MLSDAATTTAEPTPFAATTSGLAIGMQSNIPGAIGSAQIVNFGIPATRVALDTSGTSNAVAALPDPGDIIGGGTGLVGGLLALGAYGLPPLELPTLPDYPLLVATDVNSESDASLGSGPYALKAHSEQTEGSADAIGGVSSGPSGNAALIRSTSAIVTKPNGNVVASSVGLVEGLTIGPITIGQIQSTARMTLDGSGTATPYAKTVVRSLGIGGLGVDIDPDRFLAADQAVPVSLSKIVNNLLKPSGITLAVKPSRIDKNEVVASALVITFPVPQLNGVSSGPGTFTVTIGGSSATMQSAAPDDALADEAFDDSADSEVLGDGVDLDASLGADLSPSAEGSGSIPTPRLANPQNAAAALDPWSVRALYLVFGVGGFGAYALMHILRLIGANNQ